MTTENATKTVDLVVILSAKDIGDLPLLRELVAIQVNLSRQEPGCMRFEAFESQTVPGTFLVVERWATQSALDEHRKAKAITTIYMPKILPLVDRVLHVCDSLIGE